MCIICNCGVEGEDFLSSFCIAQEVMKKACKSMLECAEKSKDESDRKRYYKAHKHMVKTIKAWNKTEHIREG